MRPRPLLAANNGYSLTVHRSKHSYFYVCSNINPDCLPAIMLFCLPQSLRMIKVPTTACPRAPLCEYNYRMCARQAQAITSNRLEH